MAEPTLLPTPGGPGAPKQLDARRQLFRLSGCRLLDAAELVTDGIDTIPPDSERRPVSTYAIAMSLSVEVSLGFLSQLADLGVRPQQAT